MKVKTLLLMIIVLVVVIIALKSFMFIVDETEQAVVLQMGRVRPAVLLVHASQPGRVDAWRGQASRNTGRVQRFVPAPAS